MAYDALVGTDAAGQELAVELTPSQVTFSSPNMSWRLHHARFLSGFLGAVYLFASGEGVDEYHLSAPQLTPWLESAGHAENHGLRAGRPVTDRERHVLGVMRRQWMDNVNGMKPGAGLKLTKGGGRLDRFRDLRRAAPSAPPNVGPSRGQKRTQ